MSSTSTTLLTQAQQHAVNGLSRHEDIIIILAVVAVTFVITIVIGECTRGRGR